MKARARSSARRKLYTYGIVVGLYVVVFGWWMFFFWNQSDYLLNRVARQGVELDAVQETALRTASDASTRMLIFEGAFLLLMLAASVGLVLRSLQREVAVHRQQRNFLSAVTHELKSPLASIRLYVESLLMGRAEGEKRERYLRHALEDVVRLDRVADELLQSARMADAGPSIALDDLDLAAFAREHLDRLVRTESAGDCRIELEASGEVPVRADGRALETILRSLIGNAIKYGGEHPRLSARVARQARYGVLSLSDHGPGLGGADPERIFDAFVRGGDEDVRTRPGVGLGLFMVRELARAQGGRVRAREGDAGGLTVDVSLPLAAEGAA